MAEQEEGSKTIKVTMPNRIYQKPLYRLEQKCFPAQTVNDKATTYSQL
jgi:hypothetical protein